MSNDLGDLQPQKLPEDCEVCDEPFESNEENFSGEQARCANCGATYKVTGHDAPKCLLTEREKEITTNMEGLNCDPLLVPEQGYSEEYGEEFVEWAEETELRTSD